MIELRVPARLEYLPLLRDAALMPQALLALRGVVVAPERAQAWGLAIYEATTNVVRHGYGGGSDEPMTLRISLDAEQVAFHIEDHGAPNLHWDRGEAPPPEAVSGYGLMIIRRVMQEVSYRSHPSGRNELRLVASVAEVKGVTAL